MNSTLTDLYVCQSISVSLSMLLLVHDTFVDLSEIACKYAYG